MPHPPSRLLVPTLTLLALLFLTPTLATAFPQGVTLRSAAEHPVAAPGVFSKLWNLLSAVWLEYNNFGLQVRGGSTASSGPSSDPAAASSGDNGSGLDPDG